MKGEGPTVEKKTLSQVLSKGNLRFQKNIMEEAQRQKTQGFCFKTYGKDIHPESIRAHK